MKLRLNAVAFAAIALSLGQGAWAGEAEAKKWIDSEFQPSTLSKDQQMAEMKWFIDAAKKLQAKGVKEISVVSETITTHEYESKTLAKAFAEITGITVKHDLKALASVLLSYSCVVMVSDTTEISFTPLACSFLAASMNHFISAIC